METVTTADNPQSTADKIADKWTLHVILMFVVALAVMMRVYLIVSTHATEEDFYITLRYAQNIANGEGNTLTFQRRPETVTLFRELMMARGLSVDDSAFISPTLRDGSDAKPVPNRK